MNPCPDPDIHVCIVCGVERRHADLVRTDGGLRCRIPCRPPVIRQEVPVSRPVAAHRNPRSWIVTVGQDKLIVSLEDRPYGPPEVARLVADHAAVAVGEATGIPVRSAIREAKYLVIDPRAEQAKSW